MLVGGNSPTFNCLLSKPLWCETRGTACNKQRQPLGIREEIISHVYGHQHHPLQAHRGVPGHPALPAGAPRTNLVQGSSQNPVKSRSPTPILSHVYFSVSFISVTIVTHTGVDESQILTFLSEYACNIFVDN